VNQFCRCKIQDTGSIIRTTDDNDMKRDVLFFGVILSQLALHQGTLSSFAPQNKTKKSLTRPVRSPVLDLGGSVPRRSHNLSHAESSSKANYFVLFSKK